MELVLRKSDCEFTKWSLSVRLSGNLYDLIFGRLFLSAAALFCSFFLTSCSERPPIPEKDFVEIYVQSQILDVKYVSHPKEQKAAVDSLLKAFKVNDSLVLADLSWYSREPERWHKFFADVQTRMNQIKPGYVRSNR